MRTISVCIFHEMCSTKTVSHKSRGIIYRSLSWFKNRFTAPTAEEPLHPIQRRHPSPADAVPLFNESATCYEQKRYTLDDCQKGHSLHPQLMDRYAVRMFPGDDACCHPDTSLTGSTAERKQAFAQLIEACCVLSPRSFSVMQI